MKALVLAIIDLTLVSCTSRYTGLKTKFKTGIRSRPLAYLPTWRLLCLDLLLGEGDLLPSQLLLRFAVPVRIRTRNSFLYYLLTTSFPVSSSGLQLGMLNGCCFHTLDRSR